jgi:hypothetical protein
MIHQWHFLAVAVVKKLYTRTFKFDLLYKQAIELLRT